MLGSDELIGFVPTTNPVRARAFYEDVLGLDLVEETPYACVFQANGTMLRVTVVEELAPAPFTVLGWSVDDIAATIAELSQRGVSFERYTGVEQDELGIWHPPSGGQVAWFKDPDGNTLSLTQF